MNKTDALQQLHNQRIDLEEETGHPWEWQMKAQQSVYENGVLRYSKVDLVLVMKGVRNE